jgi:hypothetical protein
MANQANTPQRLLVVLDPDFGERLLKVRPDRAVWIVESGCNTLAVKAIWALPPDRRSLTSLTSFKPTEENPEREFLGKLDTIDLHHGLYSSPTPYTLIEVVGAQLTDELSTALRHLGFDEFRPTRRGFSANRSAVEAQRLR